MYSGNLAKDVREKDIERKFDKYGRIRDILVKYGYGFVEYDDSRYDIVLRGIEHVAHLLGAGKVMGSMQSAQTAS